VRALMNLFNVLGNSLGTRADGLRNTLGFSGSELARSDALRTAFCVYTAQKVLIYKLESKASRLGCCETALLNTHFGSVSREQ